MFDFGEQFDEVWREKYNSSAKNSKTNVLGSEGKMKLFVYIL